MKFYLAGPFFNPVQLSLIQKIEAAFDEFNIPYFSPRLQVANKSGKISSLIAKEILIINAQQIRASDMVMAVLDWKVAPNVEIRGMTVADGVWDAVTGPLNIPDSGTVWEMGYAFAIGRPTLIYTERNPADSLNVMLAKSAEGVIRGEKILRSFLSAIHDGNRFELPGWEGGYT